MTTRGVRRGYRCAVTGKADQEREQIARELHDVIAHSVSVMTVQAGAVRRLLLPEQEQERQALQAVEVTGREALDGDARLVAMLRDDDAKPSSRRSRRSTGSTGSSGRCGSGASTSRSRWKGKSASCRRGSTSPPTGCSRRG